MSLRRLRQSAVDLKPFCDVILTFDILQHSPFVDKRADDRSVIP